MIETASQREHNPTLSMNDGRQIPQLGYGTFNMDPDTAAKAVDQAIKTGYWLIDTASFYCNEDGVGRGVGEQNDVFLQTKIGNPDQGYDRTKEAAREALERLGLDHVDLLLIHWPCPDQGKFVDTWKALIELRDAGLTKSIGVSNFREEDLKRIVDETGVVPVLNQIELHPAFQQRELRRVHKDMNIITQSWSPLGQGAGMETDAVRKIAEETGSAPATVVLAWHLHHGLAPIPKAASKNHMEDNFKALELTLTDAQIASIDALDDPQGRIGPDPGNFC